MGGTVGSLKIFTATGYLLTIAKSGPRALGVRNRVGRTKYPVSIHPSLQQLFILGLLCARHRPGRLMILIQGDVTREWG